MQNAGAKCRWWQAVSKWHSANGLARSLYAASGPLGAQPLLEGNRRAFHTPWDKVRDGVEYAGGWGLKHRMLESIRAIGVDEARCLDLLEPATG